MDNGEIAREYARCLAAGAHASGVLTVRRVILSRNHRDQWEKRRFTLSQQVEIGAYAHMLQDNGRRWVWTTTQGRAQLATLRRWSPRFPIEVIAGTTMEELERNVVRSVLEGLVLASDDLRSRRCTTRGFDIDAVLTQRDEGERFRQMAAGRLEVSDEEIEDFLAWWDAEVPQAVEDLVGGLPVTGEVYRAAMRRDPGMVEAFGLVAVTRDAGGVYVSNLTMEA